MSSLRNLRNNRGTMLVQVLIATALMTTLGLALAKMFSDMWTESASLQSKSNEMVIAQAVKQQISTPALCLSSLSPQQLSSTANQEISVTINQGTAVQAGAQLPDWGLQINSLQLKNINVAMPSLNGNTLFVGDMAINAQALTGKKMPYRTKEMGKIFLSVRDSDRQILSCYSTESASGVAESACKSLGGQFNSATQVCNTSALVQGLKDQVKSELFSQIVQSMGSCGQGQAVSGINGNGQVNCVPMAAAPTGGSREPEIKTCGHSYNSTEVRPTRSAGNGCCTAGSRGECTYVSSSVANRNREETTYKHNFTCTCFF